MLQTYKIGKAIVKFFLKSLSLFDNV
jgi:hypothetical protein